MPEPDPRPARRRCVLRYLSNGPSEPTDPREPGAPRSPHVPLDSAFCKLCVVTRKPPPCPYAQRLTYKPGDPRAQHHPHPRNGGELVAASIIIIITITLIVYHHPHLGNLVSSSLRFRVFLKSSWKWGRDSCYYCCCCFPHCLIPIRSPPLTPSILLPFPFPENYPTRLCHHL